MILGFILLFLIMIIGGDRGVISLISLVGNMLLLSLAIWLMAAGAPVLLVTVGVGIIISCVTLFYQNGSRVVALPQVPLAAQCHPMTFCDSAADFMIGLCATSL